MSRVGRKPIKVPEKVKLTVKEHSIVVEGPLGKIEGLIPEGVKLEIKDGIINVIAPKASRQNRGFQGLMRAVLANMVTGVVKGFERSLEISGVGYKAELKGQDLHVAAGYSHIVKLKVPTGVKVAIDKTQTKLSVTGIDKQLVRQFAAQIRAVKEPEPYKGKGIKYAEEVIRRKVGKAGAK